MKPYKFIISGGGTGGHIFPALAIASELKKRFDDASFLFVGALGKMEMEKVPAHGFSIKGVWIDGFQRSLSLRNLMFPIKLLVSLFQAYFILKRFNPDIAIGTGGFASGSLLIVAQWLKIPTLIQEQNSYPGITNKILARRVDKICVAFSGLERYFPKEKIQLTGNPIRPEIQNIMVQSQAAKLFFGLKGTLKTLLILGGSLGARRINELVADHVSFFKAEGYQVLWQCGSLYYEKYKDLSQEGVIVVPFVAKMDHAFAAADLIISRSGAGTLAELCSVAKPVILIPSPNVAENHQYHNAKALSANDAAVVIEEINLNQNFKTAFKKLSNSPSLLLEMHRQLKHLAKPDAAKVIVDQIEELL